MGEQFHQYHLSLHLNIHRTNFINHMHFFQWGLQQYESDQSFFKKKFKFLDINVILKSCSVHISMYIFISYDAMKKIYSCMI